MYIEWQKKEWKRSVLTLVSKYLSTYMRQPLHVSDLFLVSPNSFW